LIFKKAILPNILTLGNLFLGFNAILMVSRGHLLIASWLIIVAGILDGLDGTVARLTNSDSEFGKEIDSLVDTVSFGVAPAILIYKVIFEPLGLIGFILAFFPLVAGVSRLARFNISLPSKSKRKLFKGMPITSAAGILASFHIYSVTINAGSASQVIWFTLTPAVSLLMISPFPYRRLPVIRVGTARYPHLSVAVLIGVALLVLWNPALTLFPLGMAYLISGPVEYGLLQLRRVRSQEDDEATTRHIVDGRRNSPRYRWRKK